MPWCIGQGHCDVTWCRDITSRFSQTCPFKWEPLQEKEQGVAARLMATTATSTTSFKRFWKWCHFQVLLKEEELVVAALWSGCCPCKGSHLKGASLSRTKGWHPDCKITIIRGSSLVIWLSPQAISFAQWHGTLLQVVPRAGAHTCHTLDTPLHKTRLGGG